MSKYKIGQYVLIQEHLIRLESKVYDWQATDFGSEAFTIFWIKDNTIRGVLTDYDLERFNATIIPDDKHLLQLKIKYG